jgi:hypothetical protein
MANQNTPPPAMESIDQFVNWAVETAQVKGPKIVDWLYAEVPEVVAQFLAWSFAESFISFIISAFFIFIYPILYVQIVKKIYVKCEVDTMRNKENFWIPVTIAGVITLVISQIVSWNFINLTWLKVWLAPKVFLLETFANVVK